MVGELRRQVLQDLKTTIQSDFGQKIRISTNDPDVNLQRPKTFIGSTNNIHLLIDEETGLMVSGESAHCILVLKEIMDHFKKLPQKLWLVEFLEIHPNKFRVKDVLPDHSQGAVMLTVGN